MKKTNDKKKLLLTSEKIRDLQPLPDDVLDGVPGGGGSCSMTRLPTRYHGG